VVWFPAGWLIAGRIASRMMQRVRDNVVRLGLDSLRQVRRGEREGVERDAM
jgi:hypothetical protein